jgi:hypothetical protein
MSVLFGFERKRAVKPSFWRREDGNLAVEAMIIFPVLFWAFLALIVIFDAYRQHSLNQKAAYTIGDLVSRQPNAIDPAFLTGSRQLFDTLIRSSNETSLRVTSVWYDAASDTYMRGWSETDGSQQPATEAEVAGWRDLLPIMPNFESITVVETWSRYQAPFNVGIVSHDIRNFIFTRPRYAPNITWSGT